MKRPVSLTQQNGNVGGVTIHTGQVRIPILVEIFGNQSHRSGPDLIRHPFLKCPIPAAQENKQVVARIADGSHIEAAVAIEVAQDHALRIRLTPARVGQIGLERSVSQPEENRNIVRARIGGGQVRPAVAVEVGREEV